MDNSDGFILRASLEGLELVNTQDPHYKPLIVDFIKFLRKKNQGSQNLLKRAVGFRANKKNCIWDLTAGLCEDALRLAQMGAQVVACERQPLIFQLIEDARNRALLNDFCPEWLKNHFKIEHKDGIQKLNEITKENRPDVIYLDPMYPDLRSKSLPRKEMQFFRLLIGSESNAEELLTEALKVKNVRVVLKRPLKAVKIMKPQGQIIGKTVRFDIYLNF